MFEDDTTNFQEYTRTFLIDKFAYCSIQDFESFRDRLSAEDILSGFACAIRNDNSDLICHILHGNLPVYQFMFGYAAQLNNKSLLQHILRWELKHNRCMFSIEQIASALAWLVEHKNIYMANQICSHYGLEFDLISKFFPGLTINDTCQDEYSSNISIIDQ